MLKKRNTLKQNLINGEKKIQRKSLNKIRDIEKDNTQSIRENLKISLPLKAISLNQAYPTGKNNRRFLSSEGKVFKEEIYYRTLNKCKWKLSKEDKFCVMIDFWFKDKRVRDVDNYFKMVLDSLTGIVWVDDSQILILNGAKHQDFLSNRIDIEIIRFL